MREQLEIDFENLLNTTSFSEKDIKFKKDHLTKFIKSGFPSRKLENWKFLDLNQIIILNLKISVGMNFGLLIN